MKNMDVFNIESVCLLLLFLLLFKLGFAEYSKKCIYILKKTKNTKKNSQGLASGWFPLLWGFVIWF